MNNQIGKEVIVRADKAGVFFGTLVAKNGSEVQLSSCRKLFYWSGANTVEDLAEKGVTKPKDCKFTVVCDEVTINNYIQILTCTENAAINIKAVPVWEI